MEFHSAQFCPLQRHPTGHVVYLILEWVKSNLNGDYYEGGKSNKITWSNYFRKSSEIFGTFIRRDEIRAFCYIYS